MPVPVVFLPQELSKPLQAGHPWIYRDRLPRKASFPSGTWVQVQCGKHRAYGLWDEDNPIAVRLFSWEQVPDAQWVALRIRESWDRRARLRTGNTTAYRWINGEGDGLPGIVVDLYNDYAVIEVYCRGLRSLLDWVSAGLQGCTHLKGILLRDDGTVVLAGRRPTKELIVQENGLRLRVDLFAGQKTGLYLDHRDNRQYLEGWCAGKRVLNCFAYTGAFTLYAVRGGASEVVSADIAPQAVGEIRRNLELDGFAADQHPCVVADCFELLPDYARQGRQFDLVILDPPSLGRTRRGRYTAIRAYERLNRAAMRCVTPGGLLATASCTSQVSPPDFIRTLGRAATLARRRLLIVHDAGQALDHPVPAHFGEGRYLKFVLGYVLGRN